MKKFCRVFLAVFLSSIIAVGFYIGGQTTVECSSGTFSISNAYLSIMLVVALLLLCGIHRIYSLLKCIFAKKTLNTNSFAKELELILSAILLKDADAAEQHVKKISNEINGMPLFYWLNGNIQILRNNLHKAKSLFYMASASEGKSSLGSYSLCRLAAQTKDKITEQETLETVLQTSGYKETIVMRLLAISLLKKDFFNADRYLTVLEEHGKNRRLEGIVRYYESQILQDSSKLKTAYELAPEVSVVAIAYAKSLLFSQDLKKAKTVIEKTWVHEQHPELFSIYLKLQKELSDKIDAGYDLVALQTNSWIGYFEYGKFLLDNGHLFDAFCNILAAYGKCRYKCVYDVLHHVCKLLPEPKPESALEILSDKHLNEIINGEIAWHCSTCGAIHNDWSPVCDKCENLDTITWGMILTPSTLPSVKDFICIE